MNNKIKLFLTVNYFLILSLNVLFSIDIHKVPDKITQMQIKAIQAQLKNKTISEAQIKTANAKVPENLTKLDYIGGESDIEILAIGIGHDVSRYYNKAIKIADVQELGDVMISQLSGLFENKKKLN